MWQYYNNKKTICSCALVCHATKRNSLKVKVCHWRWRISYNNNPEVDLTPTLKPINSSVIPLHHVKHIIGRTTNAWVYRSVCVLKGNILGCGHFKSCRLACSIHQILHGLTPSPLGGVHYDPAPAGEQPEPPLEVTVKFSIDKQLPVIRCALRSGRRFQLQ